MMPMPVPPPPVQQARRQLGEVAQSTSTVQKVFRPDTPPPSRIDQRPTVLNKWGFMAGLGADTERLQVQQPGGAASGDMTMPLICGVVGYLIVGALAK